MNPLGSYQQPLLFSPDLFYRNMLAGTQLGYSNQQPDTAETAPAAPATPAAPAAPAAPMPQIPQIGPVQASPVPGYTLRGLMSPEALGEDPIRQISEIVYQNNLGSLWERLLRSVLQVRPPNFAGRMRGQ